MKTSSLSFLALAAFCCPFLFTPESRAVGDEEIPEEAKMLSAGLQWQSGEIDLQGGIAHVSVPESMRFLDARGARTLLEQLWGDPPASDVIGLLAPKNVGPLDEQAWAVVITYENDGHVKDDDAASIDYAELLKQMQEGTAAANEARRARGYPAIEIVGWAAPPRYDATAKKLYWAKELKFEGGTENTLNYNIRVPGRQGVMVLNAVAGMSQLREIETATPTILAAVDFKPGNRYADFNAGTDKVATCGLAGLIAGGVLAKTGMLAKLGLIFAKFFKVFLIGGAVLVGVTAKFFGKKKSA